MSRITPVEPPFDEVIAPLLEAMMPAGVAPIGLFRTFVRNPEMTTALRGWGAYELGRSLSLTVREREIVILRTCARCACEYEWGVHVAYFADRAGLDPAQLASLTTGSADDRCWAEPAEQALIEAVDQLHDGAAIDDATWDRLAADRSEAQLLDLLLLTGWYHAISYAANGARVAPEVWAPRFADIAGRPSDSGTD
jgi:alkylhydroperoxidase family enzyme